MNAVRKPPTGKQELQMEVLSFNCLLSGEMRRRAEVKTTLAMIDRELDKFESTAELDFRAGYLSGRIDEKKYAGFITVEDAEKLKSVLYAKYEIIRRLGT